jgi:hypothetical protein
MTPIELVQHWIAATDDVALLFASEPDSKVDTALAEMRRNLIAKFCVLFPSAPPATMAAGIDTILGSIQHRRREIEAAGAIPRVSN